MIHEADIVLAYSQNKDTERPHGLARVFVDKVRRGRDKFWVLITQNYDIGQFALDSVEYDKAMYETLLESSPGGDSTASKRVTDEELDKAIEALKASGKQQWRTDNRSPDWIGHELAAAMGTNSRKRLDEVVSGVGRGRQAGGG